VAFFRGVGLREKQQGRLMMKVLKALLALFVFFCGGRGLCGLEKHKAHEWDARTYVPVNGKHCS